MESQISPKTRISFKDTARRAKIVQSCHTIFEEMTQQTSRPDVFPDFKFTFENVENKTQEWEASESFSKPFEFPLSPIENKHLLEGEADLERKNIHQRRERALSEVSEGHVKLEDIVDPGLQFERITCEGQSVAGVRLFVNFVIQLFGKESILLESFAGRKLRSDRDEIKGCVTLPKKRTRFF